MASPPAPCNLHRPTVPITMNHSHSPGSTCQKKNPAKANSSQLCGKMYFVMQLFSQTEGSKHWGRNFPQAALARELLWAGMQDGCGAPAERMGGC